MNDSMPTYVRTAPYVLAVLGAVVVAAFCFAFDARWWFYLLTPLGALKGYADGTDAVAHWHMLGFSRKKREEER